MKQTNLAIIMIDYGVILSTCPHILIKINNGQCFNYDVNLNYVNQGVLHVFHEHFPLFMGCLCQCTVNDPCLVSVYEALA